MGVWAASDWIDSTERRSQRFTTVALWALFAGGAVLYVAGFVGMWASAPWSLAVLIAGLVAVIVGAPLHAFLYWYRRIADDASLPGKVFHISPAFWEVGEQVTLEIDRCRKKQWVLDGWCPRWKRMVFVFMRRPTLRHAQDQILAGAPQARRYLYELELRPPFGQVYACGPALAVSADTTVVVTDRQEVGSLR